MAACIWREVEVAVEVEIWEDHSAALCSALAIR